MVDQPATAPSSGASDTIMRGMAIFQSSEKSSFSPKRLTSRYTRSAPAKAPIPEFIESVFENTPPRMPYTNEYTPMTSTGFQGNRKSRR